MFACFRDIVLSLVAFGAKLVSGARPVRVLLVDHDPKEEATLSTLLEQSSFVTSVGPSPEVAAFAVIAVGASGPLEERIERCRVLRERGYAGGVLASCSDAAEGERLLEAGADDFVIAPFTTPEFVTRLRACARRAAARSWLRWGPLELDRVGRAARLHGGPVELTGREFELLSCLVEAGGGIVSRDTLRKRVFRRAASHSSNLVEVHLSRLRDKLGGDAAMIETVRGAGYRLRR